LKRAVPIFLVILVLVQLLGCNWILISFKINQESIARTLCVQRNIKNNSCHGCCQLKKRLAEKDRQDQKQLPRGQKEKDNTPSDYLQCETAYKLDLVSAKKCRKSDFHISLLSAFPIGVFHPPQA